MLYEAHRVRVENEKEIGSDGNIAKNSNRKQFFLTVYNTFYPTGFPQPIRATVPDRVLVSLPFSPLHVSKYQFKSPSPSNHQPSFDALLDLGPYDKDFQVLRKNSNIFLKPRCNIRLFFIFALEFWGDIPNKFLE